MREIKYRAWVKDIGATFPVKTLFLESNICRLNKPYGNTEYMDDEIELMQFTGLHDKNGVEIYEGDVVKVIQKEDGFYMVSRIVRIPMQFIFQFENGTKSIWNFETNSEEYEIEKIGNIYENPELLESEE